MESKRGKRRLLSLCKDLSFWKTKRCFNKEDIKILSLSQASGEAALVNNDNSCLDTILKQDQELFLYLLNFDLKNETITSLAYLRETSSNKSICEYLHNHCAGSFCGRVGGGTYFCERSNYCYVYMNQFENQDYSIECDGIVHCPLAEDEDFTKCKDTFPESATIECEYKYYEHMTILATPCNGIAECANDYDEKYCWVEKFISNYSVWFILSIFFVICLIWIFHVIFYTKKYDLDLMSVFKNIKDEGFTHNGFYPGIKGDDLANLKVREVRMK